MAFPVVMVNLFFKKQNKKHRANVCGFGTPEG